MPGQILQFPIRLGVDEGTNPKALEPGRLKTAVNVQFDKNGRLGKRFAVRTLGNAVANGVTNARRLITRGSELSVVSVHANSGAALHTYLPASSAWVEVDDVPDVGLTWKTILDDHRGARSSDFGISGTRLLHAWVTGDPTSSLRRGDLWYQILDTATDEVVGQPLKLDTSVSRVRIVMIQGYAFIFYSTNASGANDLCYTSINMTTLAQAVVGASVSSDLDVDGLLFDAVAGGPGTATGAPTRILIVRGLETVTTVRLTLHSQTTGTLSAALDTENDATVVDGIQSIAVASSESTVWTLYGLSSESAVRCKGYAVTASALTINGGGADYDSANFEAAQVSVEWITATTAVIAYSGTEVTRPLPVMRSRSVRNDGTELNRREVASSMGLCSRIFRWQASSGAAARFFAFVRSVKLAALTLAPPNTCTYLLELKPGGSLNPSPLTLVGKVDEGIGGGPTNGGALPTCVQTTNASELLAPLFYLATSPNADFVWRCGIRQVRVSFDGAHPPDFWRPIEIGQETYIDTGVHAAWDGRVVFDAGMREPDVDITSAAGNLGNGSIANGSYIYQAFASYRSYAGVYHRGPPMLPYLSGGLGPFGRNTLRFLAHSIDGKTGGAQDRLAGVLYEVHRSVANASIPYRLTFEPTYNTLFNDPTAVSNVFVDTRADSSITGLAEALQVPLNTRPPIYVQTGELEDVQPPAPYTQWFHNGRVFLIPGSRREVWWCKDIDENPGFAPGFHPTQRFVFETDLTAGWSLDDKCIISSEDALWYVVGDGPNVQGQDNQFSAPRSIQTDVGCTNPRSVVSIPAGTIFEGQRGLYLLGRDLRIAEFGDRVRDTLAAFPVITSAVLVASMSEARFTCNNANATDGRVIAYDYLRNEWLVRTYGAAIADAKMHNGAWVFVTPAGQVYYEDPTTHLDGGTAFVPQKVTFAPISADGPASWKRVKAAYMVGQSLSNHSLSMSMRRDYSNDLMQPARVFAAGSEVTSLSTLEKARVDLKFQKVQAVEVTIEDSAPSNTTAYPLGNGAGFVLEGFALVVQPKPGLPRDSEGRRG